MKILYTTVLVVMITGCAVTRSPGIVGASRSDATINASYEFGPFEKVTLVWDSADKKAHEICTGWGYKRAERFSDGVYSCESHNIQGSCVNGKRINYQYRCITNQE